MAFTIKKVRPLFTGIITTAKKYVEDQTLAGGLLYDASRISGTLNPYQTVVAVGAMTKDVKEEEVVKINFKRYAKSKHTPGAIDEKEHKQFDSMSIVYEIPMVMINDEEFLLIQSNDIEYVVEDYDVDEGGLLQ